MQEGRISGLFPKLWILELGTYQFMIYCLIQFRTKGDSILRLNPKELGSLRIRLCILQLIQCEFLLLFSIGICYINDVIRMGVWRDLPRVQKVASKIKKEEENKQLSLWFTKSILYLY